jgi:hypothetical protein
MSDATGQGDDRPGKPPELRPSSTKGFDRSAQDPDWPREQPGLMRGLNSLVRGLTALFCALPIALLIIVWTATRSGSSIPSPVSNLLHSLGILPAIATSALLFYGVVKLGRFQPDFVAWQTSVVRARWCALFLVGLSPFLYWWCRLPEIEFFKVSALALIVIAMLFLAQLNVVLRRLTAILPDQTLRAETAFMARFNHVILAVVGAAEVFFFSLNRPAIAAATEWLTQQHLWLLRPLEIIVLLLMVMPIAITMAVMWKIKEVILESVFQNGE